MINIYDGTLGSFVDKDKLETELKRLMVDVTESMSYEVKEGRTKVVLITGKHKEEESVSLFQHPFIFDTIRGETALALDLRPFMKANLEGMDSVVDKMQDRYNGVLQLQRLVFNKLMLDDDTEWLPFVKTQLVEAFASLISTTTSMMVFDRTIIDNVAIVSKLHMVSMDDEEAEHKLSDYLTRLSRKDIQSLTHGDQRDLYGYLTLGFDKKELYMPSRSIGSLVNNIKYSITTGRGDGLTADLYLQTLSRSFFSLDSKNISIALVEHLPTFMAVVINVMLEGVNSKSTFRKIIEGNKRVIKGKELAVQLNDIYTDELL